jgi:hypothetical protein
MRWFLLIFLIVVLSGCATRQSPELRRQERAAAYANLAPEFKALVDQGQIKMGMPMDAVYIAWGKPSNVIQGESPQGSTVTWLYYGTTFEEYRYWGYRSLDYYHGYSWPSPSMETDYVPRQYVRAEVTFENGIVRSWRQLPRPPRW